MTVGVRFLSVAVMWPMVLMGCAANSSHNSVAESVSPVASMSHCGLTAPGLVLAQNPGDWQKLSDVFGSQIPAWPDAPDHWLLVASLGQQRTGGYGVDFKNAEMSGGRLLINVAVRRPPADAMVTQALTTPCLIVELPSSGWDTVTVDGSAPFPMSRKHP